MKLVFTRNVRLLYSPLPVCDTHGILKSTTIPKGNRARNVLLYSCSHSSGPCIPSHLTAVLIASSLLQLPPVVIVAIQMWCCHKARLFRPPPHFIARTVRALGISLAKVNLKTCSSLVRTRVDIDMQTS